MKTFVAILASILAVSVAFPQPPEEPDVVVRAPSTFQNCDCQCDSYTWTSKGKILGNCLRLVLWLRRSCNHLYAFAGLSSILPRKVTL